MNRTSPRCDKDESTARRSLDFETNRQQLSEQGYTIIRNLVPREQVDAAVDAILQFLGANREDPSTWYRSKSPTGFVDLYHHQAQWDIRQSPPVYNAFAEIIGRQDLWVRLDRVALKPPVRQEPPTPSATFLHLDASPARSADSPPSFQGVLYLSDTTAEHGGFQCIPGVHNRLQEFVAEHPAVKGQWFRGITKNDVRRVAGNAGDLIVFDERLPHGNGLNMTSSARMAMYLTMSPAEEYSSTHARLRRDLWENMRPPYWARVWENVREQKNPKALPARLTPLGRKLVGIDSWGLQSPPRTFRRHPVVIIKFEPGHVSVCHPDVGTADLYCDNNTLDMMLWILARRRGVTAECASQEFGCSEQESCALLDRMVDVMALRPISE